MGGNQGDIHGNFVECMHLMDRDIGRITAQSRIYATKAWGPVAQPDFLNMAIAMRTALPPVYLLKKLLELEKKFGRKREVKYGPRTIDIDILFYGNLVIRKEGLGIPHPEIQNRRFALVPCCDIAPGFVHPVLNRTLRELLEECSDQLDVALWMA
jgi:2-amino-4-hydroxy-6-hydroxymethyldihydropteridine diphosphokinase